jgi:hypothetical protein
VLWRRFEKDLPNLLGLGGGGDPVSPTFPEERGRTVKLSIEGVAGGYILSLCEGESVHKTVIEQHEDEESAEVQARLLCKIAELLGEGSRHDAKRVYVITHPGDKHQDYDGALDKFRSPDQVSP